MSFNWINTPQLPSPNLPIQQEPSDTGYKVNEVANSVDWGGQLVYNTTNNSYDVEYSFDSLNIKTSHINTAYIANAFINSFTGNIVTANSVQLNVSSISNLTVNIAVTPNTPESNSSVINKEYVDNAISSISGGAGFDTTANLFLQKGDLLVGVSVNTAVRLPVGSDGQVLSIDSSTPQKVVWKDAPRLSQSTFGMLIGSHEHPLRKQTTIQLRSADTIEMETGEFVTGWSNLTANLLSSGAGGLDSNSQLSSNSWYEVYAIYNPSTNEKNLLLHRSKQRVVDQSWPQITEDDGWQFRTGLNRVNYLRRSDTALTSPFDRYLSKLSQSFVAGMSGPLRAVDLVNSCVVAVDNFKGNVWVTIQNDDGTGNAGGTIFSTSRSFNLGEFDSVNPYVGHFIFDTQPILTQGNRYHIVVEGDWTINLALNNSANGYALFGNLASVQFPPNQQFWMSSIGYSVPKPTSQTDVILGYGDARTYNVVTEKWSVSANLASVLGTGVTDYFFRTHMMIYDTSVVLPTGYTKKALVSYACTNSDSRLKEYHQVNKTMSMSFDDDWRAWTPNNPGNGFIVGFVDMKHTIPPVPCLVRFCVTCNSDEVRFTPHLSYSKFINVFPFAPLRGMFTMGQRFQQVFHTPEVDMSDLQAMLAREALGGETINYYISSITF